MKYNKKYSFIKDIRKNPVSYLLTLPAMVYTIIFGYMTLPWIIIAFQRYNYRTGLLRSTWIGFSNFEFFFKSTHFLNVTWNTIRLNGLFIITGTIAAVALAILLNEIKSKWFIKLTQSSLLFPYFISWIISSYFVLNILSYRYGLLNQLLYLFDQDPVSWYSIPGPWTWILVILRLWKGAGIGVIIYLAAISGMDNQLYEAATVDGCTRWQQIRHITIPLLVPTICILTLLSIGRIFYGDFGMIYAIIRDNGMLYSTTDVIDTYVFRALRKTGDPSQAMAIGLYQAFIGFVLVFGSNRIVKKYFSDGALF